MTNFPPFLAELVGEIQRAADARAIAEAEADPQAHKLSPRFAKSARYRYWHAGRDGRGREVRFCWSTGRNIAGYFLTWREVIGKQGGRRDQFSAKKSRKGARALAGKRREAWRLRYAGAFSAVVAAQPEERA